MATIAKGAHNSKGNTAAKGSPLGPSFAMGNGMQVNNHDILVVDDDGHIREVVRFALEKAGFVVTEAADGTQALAAIARQTFAAIVLDIIMPEMDGLEVCRRLRGERGALPILFLSSRDEELDRILGLEMGADDYITKPFSPRELVARLKAVLRRTRTQLSEPAHKQADDAPEPRKPPMVLGPLSMDLDRFCCTWDTTEVVLTVTEFGLLRAMLRTPGKVFTRSELVDRAYGDGHVITERTVDSHVRRIRKKFAHVGGDPVETVYGVGYRMRETI